MTSAKLIANFLSLNRTKEFVHPRPPPPPRRPTPRTQKRKSNILPVLGSNRLCRDEKATYSRLYLGHSLVHFPSVISTVQRDEFSPARPRPPGICSLDRSCRAPVPRDQWTPPLWDFPYMLKSVSTKCVETGCLYRGLEAWEGGEHISLHMQLTVKTKRYRCESSSPSRIGLVCVRSGSVWTPAGRE